MLCFTAFLKLRQQTRDLYFLRRSTSLGLLFIGCLYSGGYRGCRGVASFVSFHRGFASRLASFDMILRRVFSSSP
jgi:hypothetical protein